jgi:signal transduction histidine kinase
MTQRIAVVVALADPGDARRMAGELRAALGDECRVDVCEAPDHPADRVGALLREGLVVPVLVVDGPAPGAGGGGRRPRLLAVVPPGLPSDPGADATVSPPFEAAGLRGVVARLVTSYLAETDPGLLAEVPGLADVGVLVDALGASRDRVRAVRDELEEWQGSFFEDDGLSDDEVERRMIGEIDRVLGRPPRRIFPAGSTILREGSPVDGILVVLRGEVRLYRTVDGEDLTFHNRTAGRIIGLLAMARSRPAFFSCEALTEVEAIPLSFEQLSDALHAGPSLTVHFVSVLVRSLARRNLRGVELQVERDRLARDLATERDQLQHALERLEQAQTRLIQSEKMATLGQLVAGIGHELNNPVAAIERLAGQLAGEIPDVVAASGDPHADLLAGFLEEAAAAEPRSTRRERQLRRDLGETLGDEELARRLVAVGITDERRYREVFGALGRDAAEDLLERIETHHRIGTALHGIGRATHRVADLVRSLRSYARAGRHGVAATGVVEGIEETLLLLGHALQRVEVVREYGDVPEVTAYPGELAQVWTNLITNAIQAMEGEGVLTVAVDAPDPGHVRVEVADDGPGIPPEDLDRVFDLHFTTKHGRVEFGLGLGLRIAYDVVARHHGRITVESRPGRTAFTVTLPVSGTPQPAPGLMQGEEP